MGFPELFDYTAKSAWRGVRLAKLAWRFWEDALSNEQSTGATMMHSSLHFS